MHNNYLDPDRHIQGWLDDDEAPDMYVIDFTSRICETPFTKTVTINLLKMSEIEIKQKYIIERLHALSWTKTYSDRLEHLVPQENSLYRNDLTLISLLCLKKIILSKVPDEIKKTLLQRNPREVFHTFSSSFSITDSFYGVFQDENNAIIASLFFNLKNPQIINSQRGEGLYLFDLKRKYLSNVRKKNYKI